jgi:hypothetical protein
VEFAGDPNSFENIIARKVYASDNLGLYFPADEALFAGAVETWPLLAD